MKNVFEVVKCNGGYEEPTFIATFDDEEQAQIVSQTDSGFYVRTKQVYESAESYFANIRKEWLNKMSNTEKSAFGYK